MRSAEAAFLKVTLKKSPIGKKGTHRRTMVSLGLHNRGDSRVFPAQPNILGQINKIIQFVHVDFLETSEVL